MTAVPPTPGPGPAVPPNPAKPGPFPPVVSPGGPHTQQFATVPPQPVPPQPVPPHPVPLQPGPPQSGPPSFNPPFSGPPGLPPLAPPARPLGGGRAPLALSLAALLLAVVSGVLALYALGVAQGAKSSASGAQPGPGSTGQPANPGPAATTDQPGAPVTPAESATPGQLDPKANYTSKYQQQVLTLRAPTQCCGSLGIDLDEPRVDVDDAHADLLFANSNSNAHQPIFTLPSGVSATPGRSPAETPNDCVETIRTGPLGDRASIPITRDVVLCLATSSEAATGQGITRKVVLVTVTAINSQDGSVDVTVSAWNAPR